MSTSIATDIFHTEHLLGLVVFDQLGCVYQLLWLIQYDILGYYTAESSKGFAGFRAAL